MELSMAILSDKTIRRLAEEQQMIEPFEAKQVRAGRSSYGLSSFGYDIRVGNHYKVFTDVFSVVVDPKNFDPRSFVDIEAECCIILRTPLHWPPRSNTSAFPRTSW
jgi:dCTP deaminase